MQQQTVDLKELARLAAASGADLPATALEPLAVYLEMLCRWNTAMNLTGARNWQDALTRLAVDSFHLAAFLDSLDLPAAPLSWDLGSGAGLPGIPLRLVWTRGAYYLVEVREKRALFLSSVLSRLRLPATHVFRGSVEHFFQGQCCPADCIVSRAFMPWRNLLDLALPHLRPEGVLIILALTPAPEQLPAPWRLGCARSYTVAGRGRWFWALRPAGPGGTAHSAAPAGAAGAGASGNRNGETQPCGN
ncbi:RsmG family class I SAM-dependent methyltransferase [Desulfovibrio sp. ZJ200]|uniref:16S rRNA (guanine(527)-N(7))-methyltransferase RsmG n=1 Tax=Desulfovibrio sp. ZJ200 TaxID=2709792 RepID=UPI0013E9DE72|nr:RsmG family class I SAM-dependent methyltransferase [Desulfovibrio sp. ZJ200]